MHGGLALNTISARALARIVPPVPEPLVPISYPIGRAWHALYTHPRCELRACMAVKELGFGAYVPTYRAEVRHARKVRIENRPAFTRYVFAHFDLEREAWGEILSADGVLWPVMANGVPCRIPEALIAEVKRLEAIGWFDRLTAKSRFERGERVRVIEGPLADRFVEFSADHGKTVEVLMEILGGKSPVKLPLEFLEKV